MRSHNHGRSVVREPRIWTTDKTFDNNFFVTMALASDKKYSLWHPYSEIWTRTTDRWRETNSVGKWDLSSETERREISFSNCLLSIWKWKFHIWFCVDHNHNILCGFYPWGSDARNLLLLLAEFETMNFSNMFFLKRL